jgi:alpha-1,2-mannosyltransferase
VGENGGVGRRPCPAAPRKSYQPKRGQPLKWLKRERLTIYPIIFLIFYIIVGACLVISAVSSRQGMVDFWGRPLGADFSHYWLASSMVLAGDPAAVYNYSQFLAAEEAFFKTHFPMPWFYPPTFLLIISPLALLPYLPSLFIWLGLTLAGYLLIIRRIAPHPLTLLLSLAFPGTIENFFHGQNGFLSTMLLGGGLLFLENHPVAAGFLLGLLSYKPHLVPLIPIALIAGRRWRALLAMLISALMLSLLSLLVLGPGVWIAFVENISLPMQLLQDGSLPVNKMVTLFAAARLSGCGLTLSLIIQAGLMVGVAAAVFWVWRRETSLALQASALILGILLFSPYAFPYDLAMLALPLAWLGWEGFAQGCTPGEEVLLSLGWFMPLIAPILGMVKFQLAPLILLGLFVFVLKKCTMSQNNPLATHYQEGKS